MKFFITILLTLTILSASIVSTNNLNIKSFEKQSQKRIQSWKEMKRFAKDKKLLNKLKIVNDYFNKLNYTSDIKKWKKEDYWATPNEFLKAGVGDCEDFAIAKYFTLKELGIKEDKLKLIYTKLTKNNQAHIVLSYYHKPNYIPIILDNVNKKLQISTKRKDLQELKIIDTEVIYSKFKQQSNEKLN